MGILFHIFVGGTSSRDNDKDKHHRNITLYDDAHLLTPCLGSQDY